MSSDENVIALVVQRHHLSSLDLRLRGEDLTEQVCCQQTQRRAEIIQDQLWIVGSRVSVAGEFGTFHPIADAEVEHWAMG